MGVSEFSRISIPGNDLLAFYNYKYTDSGNIKKLNDYYSYNLENTRYIDFSDYSLPEYGYGDISHLNYRGAELFSKYLENNYTEIFFDGIE
ncbi:hypothetical protein FACS1894137_19140 [Spirochaetia bacterium]|nr:hypothetical protein FACS1894137_19140 [Spirochaetia bacterium]